MYMKNQKNVTVIKMIEKSEGDISYTYTLFFERSGKVASFGLPLYNDVNDDEDEEKKE